MYTGPVFDFGVLPPTPAMIAGGVYEQPERGSIFARACGFESPSGLFSKSMDDMVDDMDRGNVGLAVIRGRQQSNLLEGTVLAGGFLPSALPTREISDVAHQYPGRFLAYVGIREDMLEDPAASLDSVLADETYRGVMLSAGYFTSPRYANDASLFPLYEYCQARRVPVMINFGGNSGPDISFTDPRILDDIARQFAEMTVVVHHGGWPWVTEALHIAFRRPNIYLSPDMHIFGMPGWRDYVDAGNGFLQDRLLYASYYPFLPIAPSATRFAELFKEEVQSKVLYENARRLLSPPSIGVGSAG